MQIYHSSLFTLCLCITLCTILIAPESTDKLFQLKTLLDLFELENYWITPDSISAPSLYSSPPLCLSSCSLSL